MQLEFKDVKGNTEVLATGDNLAELKSVVSSHYAGDELIIWKSGPIGKSYSETVPEVPCTCEFYDGTSYSIS